MDAIIFAAIGTNVKLLARVTNIFYYSRGFTVEKPKSSVTGGVNAVNSDPRKSVMGSTARNIGALLLKGWLE